MYYLETKAMCCHPHFGQFLCSHQTLGEEEVDIIVDSILQFLMHYELLEQPLTNTEQFKTYFFYLKQIYRNEYILIPLNFVPSAAMQTTDR